MIILTCISFWGEIDEKIWTVRRRTVRFSRKLSNRSSRNQFCHRNTIDIPYEASHRHTCIENHSGRPINHYTWCTNEFWEMDFPSNRSSVNHSLTNRSSRIQFCHRNTIDMPCEISHRRKCIRHHSWQSINHSTRCANDFWEMDFADEPFVDEPFVLGEPFVTKMDFRISHPLKRICTSKKW